MAADFAHFYFFRPFGYAVASVVAINVFKGFMT